MSQGKKGSAKKSSNQTIKLNKNQINLVRSSSNQAPRSRSLSNNPKNSGKVNPAAAEGGVPITIGTAVGAGAFASTTTPSAQATGLT